LKYRKGYKYQLADDFKIDTDIIPHKSCDTEFLAMDAQGFLTIRSGYAWDGVSGVITIDTDNTHTPSLVHDALYQLMRQGYVHRSYRKRADKLFIKLCKNRGMNWLRRRTWYSALRKFGKVNTLPESIKKIYEVK